MKERGAEFDQYSTKDRLLGEVPLLDGAALVRFRLHRRDERIPNHPPLLPLTHAASSRSYLHAQPYVLEPQTALIVGLSPSPRAADVIGEALTATWDGMHHVTLGQAQTWF